MSRLFEPYIILMCVSSAVLWLLMCIDKRRAKHGQRRIKERTLFLFAFFGGAVGGLSGMFSFRHKTKHWYFTVGFTVLALVQVSLAVYLHRIG